MTILVLIHSPFRMWTIPVAHVEWLRREFPSHSFLHAHDDEEGRRLIADAEVAFSSQINPDHLSAARKLRWIHSPSAGVGGMLHPEMLARPVVITNGRGTSADTIAEHVIAVILALFRRLPLAFARQTERTWAQDEISGWPGNRTLAGSSVVLVGVGAIGTATAERLRGLGASVIGIRRRVGAAAPPAFQDIRATEDLISVLPSADVLVLAAPQTQQTHRLIGERELSVMNRDAILVNISRGGLIDQAALADALHHGRLAGAALDVFRHEPLSPDDPMWAVPNLLITPHTSGFVAIIGMSSRRCSQRTCAASNVVSR